MSYSIPHYISSTSSDGSFGMALEGRSWSAGSEYRYSFNGKENDEEMYGPNNAVDFGSRIYDSRLGRWLSTDALQNIYPQISPYSYALANPIIYRDADGNVIIGSDGKPVIITYTPQGLQYSENITEESREILNAMAVTETGLTQIHSMDENTIRINLKLTNKVMFFRDQVSKQYIPVFAMTSADDPNNPEESVTIEISLGSWEYLSNGKSELITDDNVVVYDFTENDPEKIRKEDVKANKILKDKISDADRQSHIDKIADRVPDNELTSKLFFLNVTGVHESVHSEEDNILIQQTGGNPETPAYKRERQSFEELKNE